MVYCAGPHCNGADRAAARWRGWDGMHLEPGEKQQVLHRDTSVFPFANPCPPLTMATMWAITDFTRSNGGVRDPSESDLSPAGMSERVDKLERFHIGHTAQGPARHYDVNTD